MTRVILPVLFLVFSFIASAVGQEHFERDIISTSEGDLEVSFIGHGTLVLSYGGRIIHVDPFSYNNK